METNKKALIGKRINKLMNPFDRILFSDNTRTWMHFTSMLPSERSQSEIILYYFYFRGILEEEK